MGGSLPTIITVAFVPAIAALFTLVVAMGRGIVAYLREENADLQAQRDGVLKTLVEVTKAQEESIVAIGEFVKEMAAQQEYERRRAQERRGGAA
jgi:hypothetical protein